MVSGRMRAIWGGCGCMLASRSAEPDLEVEARLPCLAMRRRLEAMIEAVVLMLKVLCESPPVPTMSTLRGVSGQEWKEGAGGKRKRECVPGHHCIRPPSSVFRRRPLGEQSGQPVRQRPACAQLS